MIDLLKSEISELSSDVARLKEDFKVESESTESKLSRLSEVLKSQTYWRNEIKTLSDVPGIRKPQWYVVDIPFDYGAEDATSRIVNMSADNAFVCRQIQSYFLIQDDNEDRYKVGTIVSPLPSYQANGRVVPTSACYPYIQQAKFESFPLTQTFANYNFGPLEVRGIGVTYPDFEFKIEIEGTGRYWASTWIPAMAFQGVQEPFYLGFEGVVENTDKIRIHANPTVAVPLKGVVRFVMHGYSIGSKISVRDQLGY